jgi:hypothetical protein
MSDQDEPLEFGLVEDILRFKARYQDLLRFHWEFYSELAFQRNLIYEPLKDSLRQRATRFEFSSWQRAVRYRYSLDPLSIRGSLVDPGGRFNVGQIDTARFPVFPGLYLASDKPTALTELLGRAELSSNLTPEELALTNPASVTIVSTSGALESVLDVSNKDALAGFVNLVKDFQLSRGLVKKARKLGMGSPELVRDVRRMSQSLLSAHWRLWPMQLDVPAPCQIFGQIVMDAGIEGVTYPSTLTGGALPCHLSPEL